MELFGVGVELETVLGFLWNCCGVGAKIFDYFYHYFKHMFSLLIKTIKSEVLFIAHFYNFKIGVIISICQ